MSLLMDALKKADEAKKKQVVATLNAGQDSSNDSQNSSAITEAKDSLAPNEVKDSLIIEGEEEELVFIEVTDTDDEKIATTTLTESTPIPEEQNDFSLITETHDPFLAEFKEYPTEEKEKNSWDDEFLPEFQKDLEELENPSIEEVTTPTEKSPQVNEFIAYDDQEFVQPQLEEIREEITTDEETQERQPHEFKQLDQEISQEPSALTPSIPLSSSRHQAKNWFLSLPTANKLKQHNPIAEIDLEAEVSTRTEPEVEQELVRIEQVTQTEPAAQTVSPTEPASEIAQRILAAHTPATSSKRTWWLSGLLGVLLVGMGGSYYYYTQSSLIQSSPLKFGQLNQRLKATTPPVDKVTDFIEKRPNPPPTLALSQPSQTGSVPIIAQAQPSAPPEPHEVTHQTTTLVEEPGSSKIPVQAPVNLVNSIENNPSHGQTTISTDNLFANKEIRAEIAKLIADEIAKQFAAKMTVMPTEQKSKKANATASSATLQPPPAAKIRLPETQPSTSSPAPTESTTAVTEPTRIPTLHKNVTEKINNQLSSAYKNFHQGNEKLAYDTYHQILQQDPNNRDALLGFAALAVRHGNLTLAQQYYQQVLQSDPQNPHAQVGLINTLNYQPTSSESQLKLLLEKSPQSAYIYFSLGNLYANQGRWAQAQQAYFDAYRYDSSQADYAYNLAISLDQLNQTGAALNYYQQALQLARNQRVNFNQPAVQKRVQTLMAHTRPSALDNLSTQ
jgi:tetratricopeptide (TPR) repeat protein